MNAVYESTLLQIGATNGLTGAWEGLKAMVLSTQFAINAALVGITMFATYIFTH